MSWMDDIALPRSEYSDAELDAECCLLGSLMLEPNKAWVPLSGLGPHSFCDPFHRAVFYAVMLLVMKGKTPDPAAVWELVRDHPDAKLFGLRHLAELVSDAATPESYLEEFAVLMDRGLRITSNVVAVLKEMH